MTNLTEPRDDLLAFEFESLSLLLHFWAEKDFAGLKEEEKERMLAKVPKFRDGVIAGLGKGGHELRIPRELVYADYKTVLHALRFLNGRYCNYDEYAKDKDRLQGVYIRYRLKKVCGKDPVERPIPVPMEDLDSTFEQLLDPETDKSRIAYNLAARRLSCKPSKIHRGGPKRGRIKTTDIHRYLISTFLDLCSIDNPCAEVRYTLATILQALFASGCHCLLLYYLILNSHKVTHQLFTGEYAMDELRNLCKTIIGENSEFSFLPFVRLVSQVHRTDGTPQADTPR